MQSYVIWVLKFGQNSFIGPIWYSSGTENIHKPKAVPFKADMICDIFLHGL